MSSALEATMDPARETKDEFSMYKWGIDVQINNDMYDHVLTQASYGWNLPERSSEPVISKSNALPAVFACATRTRKRKHRAKRYFLVACLLSGIAPLLFVVIAASRAFTPFVGVLAALTTCVVIYEMVLIIRRISQFTRMRVNESAHGP